MAEQQCEFFEWIGASGCDRCGRLPREHKGYRTLRRGRGGGLDGPWENLTWAEWDARVETERRLREARQRLDALPPETLLAVVDALRGSA